MIKYFKSRGFTDRLYILNLCLVIFVTIASYLLTIFATPLEIQDTSLFGTTVVAAYTELGIHTALIISKAKKENSKKIAIGLIKDFAEKYSIDSIAPIIQVILEDN